MLEINKNMNTEIIDNELEILNSNYCEHFKFAKELAGYLDLKHQKRVRVEKELNKMIERIHELNKGRR